MRVKHWFSTIYKVNIYYYIGWKNDEHLTKLLKKHYDIDHDHLKLRSGCTYVNHLTSQIVIWTLDKKDTAVLVHECIHAATYILHRSDIPISYENDESLCYLTEAIFRKTYEQI